MENYEHPHLTEGELEELNASYRISTNNNMTRQIQLQKFDEYTSHLRSLIESKGADYGGSSESADRLANFKIAAELMGISPSQQCLSMISTKVARLSALLRDGGTPNHESIKDSCLDLSNYGFLLAMLEDEKQEPLGGEGLRRGPAIWTTKSSVTSNTLRFTSSHQDGDSHFKVIVTPTKVLSSPIKITVSKIDVMDCYESVRGIFGDVEYLYANRLDFRVSSEHPNVPTPGVDTLVLKKWPFEVLWEEDYTEFIWTGDIPDKGM